MIFESLKQQKRTVILDTDIGPDCDDVGAIAVLLSYARELEFPVGGICNCTSSIYGTATLDALLAYCQAPNIPIGAYGKAGFMADQKYEKYNRRIAERYSKAFRGNTLRAQDHVPFYRKILANAKEKDVIILTIGMFNCLSDLLNSPPDSLSPLCGKELMEQKVYAVVSMAAKYPEGREFNVFCDAPAAKNVFENCPVPIFLSDFLLGRSIITGFAEEAEQTQTGNPIFEAYRLYTAGNPNKENYRNPSFDLTAVQFACEGEGELYGLTEPGELEFYNLDPMRFPNEDATRFVPTPNGKIRFMVKKASDEVIKRLLEERIYQFNQ